MATSNNEDRQFPAIDLTERHQTEFRRYLVSGRLSLVAIAETLTVAELPWTCNGFVPVE